jgi:ParB/Sulfiredoxin domain
MTSPSPEGATEAAPTKQLRIKDLNGEACARVDLDENAVAEYAQAMKSGAEFPPIVVFRDGKTRWLADGCHRVAAAERRGRRTIRAEVRPGDRRKAVLYACGANAAHGVRRTNADKRRAVILMLGDEEWRDWSNREIARRCVVDEGLVRQVRKELSADDPQIASGKHKVCRGDTVYVQRPKLSDETVLEIRNDDRSLKQIAKAHGIDKSQVSKIKNNKLYFDPKVTPAPKGLVPLRRAWNAACPDAKEQFLSWLWSEHPAMIGAAAPETEPQTTGLHLAG